MVGEEEKTHVFHTGAAFTRDRILEGGGWSIQLLFVDEPVH